MTLITSYSAVVSLCSVVQCCSCSYIGVYSTVQCKVGEIVGMCHNLGHPIKLFNIGFLLVCFGEVFLWLMEWLCAGPYLVSLIFRIMKDGEASSCIYSKVDQVPLSAANMDNLRPENIANFSFSVYTLPVNNIFRPLFVKFPP